MGYAIRGLRINWNPFVKVVATPVVVNRTLLVAGIIFYFRAGIITSIAVFSAGRVTVIVGVAMRMAITIVGPTIVSVWVWITVVRMTVFGSVLTCLA